MKRVKDSPLDGEIRRSYHEINKSVDEILVDPPGSTKFAQSVLSHVEAASEEFTVEDVLRRLILLRKRGNGKGGLDSSDGDTHISTNPRPR